MIGVSAIMFFIATFHLSVNYYRILRGYVDDRLSPGGPAGYIGDLRTWDHILKDALFVTQENLGIGVSIYRTWILWGNWKVVVFPIVLLTVNIIAGYTVCATYSKVGPTSTVFVPALNSWIKTFHSLTFSLNIIMTGLMSYRIWKAHRDSSVFKISEG
ncbi:hypothetical protein BDQ17DRAFT_1477651 [Cyathus striatus]|nr:hypothetical protein BDQ17DRAFT_1477651 [Cyathus striatus]